jgi:hypothetical protein
MADLLVLFNEKDAEPFFGYPARYGTARRTCTYDYCVVSLISLCKH